MTLRAGSYNARRPDWRGIIRQDGWGWYRCTHTSHGAPDAARDCARAALPVLRERDHHNPEAPMPEGWEVIPASGE
jgi:hypothetical protein